MHPLSERHIEAIAYGSIARGDVNPTSDIDIFIPTPPAPATPGTAPKPGGGLSSLRDEMLDELNRLKKIMRGE